jgi:hypothetical protein
MTRTMRAAAASALMIVVATTSLVGQEVPTQPTAPERPAATMAAGLNAGTQRAETVGTGGYLAGGVASGVLLGLIGTGITYAVAASSDVSLPPFEMASIADHSPEYIQGFRSGYGDRVKAKRKQSALTGGLLGTALFVVIVVSAGGQ